MSKQVKLSKEETKELVAGVKRASEKYLFGSRHTKNKGKFKNKE